MIFGEWVLFGQGVGMGKFGTLVGPSIGETEWNSVDPVSGMESCLLRFQAGNGEARIWVEAGE